MLPEMIPDKDDKSQALESKAGESVKPAAEFCVLLPVRHCRMTDMRRVGRRLETCSFAPPDNKIARSRGFDPSSQPPAVIMPFLRLSGC
jgi:hypothetical protein